MNLEKCRIDGQDFILTSAQQAEMAAAMEEHRRDVMATPIPDYGLTFVDGPNRFKAADERFRKRIRQIVGLPTD